MGVHEEHESTHLRGKGPFVGKHLLYQPVRVGRATVSEQVADQIIDLISQHQLKVGDRLPPLSQLTGYLQVSRTAVREAIMLLSAWGVVTVRHGVGTFIAGTDKDALRTTLQVSAERTEQALRNLHQVREALEPNIAAIATRNATLEHIAKMEEAVRTMDQALEDPPTYIQADLAFHSALAEATGNDLFLIVIHPVIDLLQDMMTVIQKTPGAMERGQEFHRRLVEQIKGGPDYANAARQTMLDHLRQAWLEVQPQAD
jgi:GntR family transcriptional repressor for pyruvate dehydrogenase complex